eukprot:TRINITY_DN34890_c0_g2_i1.p1 TRINITY_DN34890_c0_g2~~TRINITY_DN34890_c0_g2_i1.p1  ORF type:complete len:328 (+),score=65.80 TRINITY_DN34890_c0_g2_i1:44-1027(+)
MEVDFCRADAQLLRACEEGAFDECVSLLRGRANVHCFGEDGRTPFLIACHSGNLGLARLVLEARGRLEDFDSDGCTATLLAAEGGSLDVVRWLTDELGASLDDRSNDGSNMLLNAAGSGNLELLSWLLDDCLPAAAAAGLAPLCLQDRDDRGADCVLAAAEAGCVDLVRDLLRRGMNPATVDAHGCGVLHYAAAGGHVSMVEFCVRKLGVGVSARDCDGDTPLIIAAHEGNIHAVERLLQLKSSLTEKDDAGVTPLLAAAAGEGAGSAAVVEMLGRRGGGGNVEAAWAQEIATNPALVLNLLDGGNTSGISDLTVATSGGADVLMSD